MITSLVAVTHLVISYPKCKKNDTCVVHCPDYYGLIMSQELPAFHC